jgi:hypothetical protein
MPPQAYALVTLFLVCSVLVGVLAVRVVVRAGGPRGAAAHVLPVLAGFGAFYLVGHRLGIALGPEIEVFGFQVALLGDVLIGFAAALAVAGIQALVVRTVSRSKRPAQPSTGR